MADDLNARAPDPDKKAGETTSDISIDTPQDSPQVDPPSDSPPPPRSKTPDPAPGSEPQQFVHMFNPLGAAGLEGKPSQSIDLAGAKDNDRTWGIAAPGQQSDYSKRVRDFQKTVLSKLESMDALLRWNEDAGSTRSSPGAPVSADWPAAAFHASGGEPDKLAFLIALGALSGCLTAQIDQAAASLERRFRERLAIKEKPEGSGRFDLSMPRCAQLDAYRAEAYTDKVGTQTGECLRFKNSGDASRVLKFAWDQYGNVLGADVTAWLVELGDHPSYQMRAAAGASAGHLARLDFGNFDERLFEPWRTSSSIRPLDALDAGYAIAAEAEELHDVIARRVKSWAESPDNVDDVLAAGALARGVYGWKYPGDAFDLLLHLLRHNRDISFTEALQGFHSWLLWGTQEPARAQRAIIALEGATRDPAKISKDPLRRAHERTVTSLFELQICMIFLSILGPPQEGSNEFLRLGPVLQSEAAAASFARLFNRCFTVRDAVLAQNDVSPATREIARHLFLRAASDAETASVIWPFFAATLRYSDGAQGATLRRSLSTWRGRAIAMKRDVSDFDRLAGPIAG